MSPTLNKQFQYKQHDKARQAEKSANQACYAVYANINVKRCAQKIYNHKSKHAENAVIKQFPHLAKVCKYKPQTQKHADKHYYKFKNVHNPSPNNIFYLGNGKYRTKIVGVDDIITQNLINTGRPGVRPLQFHLIHRKAVPLFLKGKA